MYLFMYVFTPYTIYGVNIHYINLRWLLTASTGIIPSDHNWPFTDVVHKAWRDSQMEIQRGRGR